MKRSVITGLLSLMLLAQVSGAADLFYTNNGSVTFPPQIDAINFINNGTFDFRNNTTIFPFDTSNTQNFTNNGTMIGAVGFRFDNSPSIGPRKMAASFRNRLTGDITALDTPVPSFTLVNGGAVDPALIVPSYLLVTATNLLNEGSLIAGAGGLLRLVGTNVNLTRSALQIQPIEAQGSGPIGTNYFAPDVGIYDRYWGQTNQTMLSSTIIQAGGAVVRSPSSRVNFHLVPIPGNRWVTLQNPVGDFYTNTMSTTNISVTNSTGIVTVTNLPLTNLVQAAFIGLPAEGDFSWGVRFFPSSNPLNPLNTISLAIALNTTNGVTAGPSQATLFLVDTLASETNRSMLTNFTSIYDLRPNNYTLERLMPDEYRYGDFGNAAFSTDLFYKPDYVSNRVTNEYAAYSAFVDNIASRPPQIPAGTPTNLPGRIEIFADKLDLTRTRFRAEGLLHIKANNLVSSTNTLVDCENLSYTLGAASGSLKIENLAKEVVARLSGINSVWSGLWTNYQNMIIENWSPDPADTNVPPTTFLPANITNVVEIWHHALLWQTATDPNFGGGMLSQLPVIVNELVTRSTDVLLNDRMTVVESLLINGQSFTLNGSLTLSNKYYFNTHGDTVLISLDSWVGTNAPNLKFFTNTGTFNIPNEGHFGDDLPAPYSTFVNNGTIAAYGQAIKSDYCAIGGQNTAVAGISMQTRNGKIEGGTLTSGGDVTIYANDLKLNRATITASRRLDLTVTNSLFDAGGGSANAFSCTDGFRLLRKPPTGDLLGTTIETVAPPFAQVDHVWAGVDRGVTTAGFTNNTALGRLVLTPGNLEADFPPLFFFAGTGGGNALYVDYLDLSSLLDYQIELAINPDLIIYYAAAALADEPPQTNGVPQLPEEYLDGQFEGRLRWVRDFAGPNSSIATLVNGQTVLVNRALRNSKLIDSNGNGIPNFYDATPFSAGGVTLTASLVNSNPPASGAVVISWMAAPQTVYQVEFSSNPVADNWQPLLRYTNNATTNRVVGVSDSSAPAGTARRFYRVGFSP